MLLLSKPTMTSICFHNKMAQLLSLVHGARSNVPHIKMAAKVIPFFHVCMQGMDGCACMHLGVLAVCVLVCACALPVSADKHSSESSSYQLDWALMEWLTKSQGPSLIAASCFLPFSHVFTHSRRWEGKKAWTPAENLAGRGFSFSSSCLLQIPGLLFSSHLMALLWKWRMQHDVWLAALFFSLLGRWLHALL